MTKTILYCILCWREQPFQNLLQGSDSTNSLSLVNKIEETSFHRAWQKAAAFIDEHGVMRIIGGPKEEKGKTIIERKTIRDSCQIIVLTGNAITQMEKGELHPAFPFGPKQLEEYCNQLTPEYGEYWRSLPLDDIHRFKYLYRDRFVFPFDQLKALKENLAEQIFDQISSNRTKAGTWRPIEDAFNPEPPCLQDLQLLYLGKDDSGVNFVDVRYNWRSRDINAWQSNKACLTRMLYREVLTPNNCKILRDIDYCASLHCYEDRLNALHEAAYYNRMGNKFLIE